MGGMQYDLRTLLVVTTFGPAILAVLFWFVRHVMGMEDWKFVVAAIGLVASFYFVRDLAADDPPLPNS
jgi:hypothetical protein